MKIAVLSKTMTVKTAGLLENERPVAKEITHELLVLASDAVDARELTSAVFPESGRGNLKLLAHVVARAIGGWIPNDGRESEAAALKIGKRLGTQVQTVRDALSQIADAAAQARSHEMHQAHAASDAGIVLALPAALAAAEEAATTEYHRQQTEIYFGFHELMREDDAPAPVVTRDCCHAERRPPC